MFWNKEYKNISISFEDRIVRVLCDDILKKYLEEKEENAVVLSRYIHGTYYDMFHKELDISLHSLAVEILVHAYVDKFCLLVKDRANLPIDVADDLLKHVCQSVEKRTQVIDCGEKEVDNNRFVFDGLEKIHTIIYKML